MDSIHVPLNLVANLMKYLEKVDCALYFSSRFSNERVGAWKRMEDIRTFEVDVLRAPHCPSGHQIHNVLLQKSKDGHE